MKRFNLKSFRYAYDGLTTMIRTEPNSRVHLLAAFFAIILGFVLQIKALEWLLITLSIGIVFITELINSSIERIANRIEPKPDPKIKEIKDLAAASVLVSALASLVIGGIIFIPKLIGLFR